MGQSNREAETSRTISPATGTPGAYVPPSFAVFRVRPPAPPYVPPSFEVPRIHSPPARKKRAPLPGVPVSIGSDASARGPARPPLRGPPEQKENPRRTAREFPAMAPPSDIFPHYRAGGRHIPALPPSFPPRPDAPNSPPIASPPIADAPSPKDAPTSPPITDAPPRKDAPTSPPIADAPTSAPIAFSHPLRRCGFYDKKRKGGEGGWKSPRRLSRALNEKGHQEHGLR